MELVLIGVMALLTSGLTLFSGFGLGTILMPALALFFPAPLAVAVAVLCAFAGAVIGKRLLQKVTLRAVQRVVAGMMLLVGGLVTGLI